MKSSTTETRKKIGFLTEKSAFANMPALYDDHNLRIAGHPVMQDWETGYMGALATIACSQDGNVLELGYGMGISAGFIQSHNITKHWVIECNIDVVAKATTDLRNALSKNRASILTGFWQDVTPELPANHFNGILFDTYPLKEEEIHCNHFWFFKEAYRLLKPGGVLTYYSDEDENFSEKHMAKLLEAGFKKENIDFDICEVNPPENCEYWQSKTILVPIIKK